MLPSQCSTLRKQVIQRTLCPPSGSRASLNQLPFKHRYILVWVPPHPTLCACVCMCILPFKHRYILVWVPPHPTLCACVCMCISQSCLDHAQYTPVWGASLCRGHVLYSAIAALVMTPSTVVRLCPCISSLLQAWPIALSGKDFVGIAQTGSGKTLGVSGSCACPEQVMQTCSCGGWFICYFMTSACSSFYQASSTCGASRDSGGETGPS